MIKKRKSLRSSGRPEKPDKKKGIPVFLSPDVFAWVQEIRETVWRSQLTASQTIETILRDVMERGVKKGT